MQEHDKRGRIWYYGGLAGVLAGLAGAELIWLPAPLEMPNGMTWIEMIDVLFRMLAIIPLCWLIGALRRAAMPGADWRLRCLRWMTAASSGILAGLLLLASVHSMRLLIAAGAAIALLFTDMLASEMVAKAKAGRTRSRLSPRRSLVALAVFAVLVALFAVPTGERVTYPGMTLNLNRYAHVSGGTAIGSIDGVLVFDRPALLADHIFAALFPYYEFEPIPEDEPPLSESYAQVVAMKRDANQTAAAIAMEKAGIGEGIEPGGVRILAILRDSPADGSVQAGDIVVAINGTEVLTVADMIGYMGDEVKPGDMVALALDRGEQRIVAELTAVASASDASKPMLGVTIETKLDMDIPRSISYTPYLAHVGGPSHGAMMTLAVMDQLVPGGVTGGLKVAGTGTIEADGSIGMVGGIPQKAYAVSRTKADVFFVPEAGFAAAQSAAPGLHIVAVRTIDDVLAWLSEHRSDI